MGSRLQTLLTVRILMFLLIPSLHPRVLEMEDSVEAV